MCRFRCSGRTLWSLPERGNGNGKAKMLYVYAIIASPAPSADMRVHAPGILPDAAIHRYSCGSLSAVASPVPEAVFGPEALPACLADQAWVCERVLAHERVVSALLPETTVLPLKFGTLFSSETALRQALLAHRSRLEDALARLQGAREWGVKLFAAPPHADIAPAGAPPVTRTGAAFFRRKRDEEEAKHVARARVERGVLDSHHRLAAHARAAVSASLHPAPVHGQPGEMAFNGAYLVGTDAEPAFKATIAGLAREHEGAGMRFELTGPWGPYHFAGETLAGH